MNLKEIAKLAGVSTVTVSNVMNGKHHKASKETVDRIMRIIEETNYRPSATARSLIMKQSRIIGVVIPNIQATESFAASPYNTQILGYLERYIRSKGYYMMIRCVVESHEALADFASWNIDGAFLLGVVLEDALKLQEKLNIPAVFLDTYDQKGTLATVGVKDYDGGVLAAQYLLDMGHRQIGMVSTPVQYPGVMQERFRGFRDTIQKAGVPFSTEDCIITDNVLYEYGVKAGQQIARSRKHFTAVAAVADILALGLMEGLRMGGLRVPEDVSVIGFDNLPEGGYSHPTLTSISQQMEEKARLAGEYLFDMIQNGTTAQEHKAVDVALKERQSVIRCMDGSKPEAADPQTDGAPAASE